MALLAPQILIFFVLLGSLAGLLTGLLGAGCGIILVPLFLWSFGIAGFSPEIATHTAFGTSLCVLIPTALASTLGHRQKGNVDWRQVRGLALGGVLGALVGGTLAALLSGVWLKGLLGLMQILVAIKLKFFHPRLPPERSDPVSFRSLVLVGLASGSFSAFFGAGGGVVSIPLMLIFLQLPIQLAVGNSNALIVVSAFSGLLSYVYHGWGHPGLPPFSLGYVNFLIAATVAPVTIIAARWGTRLAGRFSHDKLVTIFAVTLLVIGTRLIFTTFVH